MVNLFLYSLYLILDSSVLNFINYLYNYFCWLLWLQNVRKSGILIYMVSAVLRKCTSCSLQYNFCIFQNDVRPCSNILKSGSGKFRHGVLQLMIHTIDPLGDGKSHTISFICISNGKINERTIIVVMICTLCSIIAMWTIYRPMMNWPKTDPNLRPPPPHSKQWWE